MPEPGEGELDAVGRNGVRQRKEVQANRNDGDGQERDDLDRNPTAGESDEHRQRQQHRGERVIVRRFDHPSRCSTACLVPLARLERALPKKLDFESSASTNSATGAPVAGPLSLAARPAQRG